MTSETRHNEAIRRGQAAMVRFAETRTIAREDCCQRTVAACRCRAELEAERNAEWWAS